jgi:nucleoside-diphosphate-sugar epimerase
MEKNIHGIDAVFHVAALAGIWGKWDLYYKANVLGTENVIHACRRNRIPVLVYTSTPSVVFNGNDIINGDESLPYPSRFLCNYARSKMQAEQMVLSVPQNQLLTCAIRPHLIWGPGDPHLIPRLIQRGREGRLKIVGDGANMVDITYIDNVAYAHILAAKNLFTRQTAAGKAYFIGQEEPVNLWTWINELFVSLNIQPVTHKVSLSAASKIGWILENFSTMLKRDKEPKMTRFLAEQLAKSHFFSHLRAQHDIGYHPLVSIEEGMKRLLLGINTL